ncbi:type IV secretion system protein VirB10 [Steroidobacter sp. S1-65]|uniref:Type IV secretion system protein VirB10 n=1 Tax=Steroidobacter gossypii TaxID=2805490 RepID=A0ABS1X6M2_9GAMM|nr:type IV secretion system protein VirB10 [Steroidobacter gossypii]
MSATYRATSLQTRLTNFVALGLGALVMTTFLVWYYKHALAERPGEGEDRSTHDRGSESAAALPPLGRIDPPLIERVLGPAPALPEETSFSELEDRRWPEARDEEPSYDGARSDRQAPDRRLSGEAFVPAAARRGSGAHLPPRTATMTAPFDGAVSTSFSSSAPESGRGELADLLEPTVLEPAQAQVLPTRRLLLPKGAFLDCTLETAISSALPGMTTCVTATDTFSADGSVVLLERGSKLIGETRGQVRAGSNRVFVLWTEARTPTGVVVPLASPGTDALGRSGLPGEVDRHFWDRFGAAILISVIDGAVQAAVQRESNGDAVIINPAGSNDIMTEVLKSTIHIPPTVTKRHGDRIAVLVARDLDFRSVYELRTAGD